MTMNDPDERNRQEPGDEKLSLLLADLFSSDERELELLVRFAREPESLSSGECARVESRLTRDPSWRDRLLVLQNFDPEAVPANELAVASAVRHSAVAVAVAAADAIERGESERARVIEIGAFRLAKLGVWAALAAAAGLVLWLNLSSQSVNLQNAEMGRDRESLLVDHSTDLQTVSVPQEIEASSYTSSNSTTNSSSNSSSNSTSNSSSNSTTYSSSNSTTTTEKSTQDIAQVRVEPSRDVPLEIPSHVRVDPPGNRQPDQTLADVELENVKTRANDALAPLHGLPAHEPSQELQLAMLDQLLYQAPVDRAMRDFLDDSLRGEPASISLEAWVPDHVARTASPQPTLYWEIRGQLPETYRLGFVITSETDAEPLYETALSAPDKSGWQAIDFARLDIRLTEDAIYRWTVFARAPSSDPSQDRIAQGWIQYRPASASLALQMSTGPAAERATHYAEGGYWYDALALLVGLSEQYPSDVTVRDALTGFLADAGVK